MAPDGIRDAQAFGGDDRDCKKHIFLEWFANLKIPSGKMVEFMNRVCFYPPIQAAYSAEA
jgi:hypothetical protein